MDPDVLDRRGLAEHVGAFEVSKRGAEFTPGLVPGGGVEFVLHERADASGEAEGEVHREAPDAVGMGVILVSRCLSELNETAEVERLL
jgi:hypothetical protein